jgi:hypothetical protein
MLRLWQNSFFFFSKVKLRVLIWRSWLWLCLFFKKVFFRKLIFKFFYIYLLLKSWWTKNIFQSKENLVWFLRKCFSKKFGRKTLSGNYEKFRNIILFADYIKFGPQNFDCYIYILFWIFIFQFYFLKFNFYINFCSHFYNCYFLFSYLFFIEIFYLSNLVFILFIVTYFIWNNL